MSKWVHVLTAIHEDGTGICKCCGPVPLTKKNGGLRCSIAVNKQRRTQKHRVRTKEQRRASYLKYDKGSHGLTPLEALRLKADKSCHICGASDQKSLAIDHCHKTNIIRGILCRRCNTGIGLFKDNPVLLNTAIEYLSEKKPLWSVA